MRGRRAMAWSGDLAGLAVDWGDASLEALLPDSDASIDTLPEFDAGDVVDASDAVDVGDAGIDALPNDDASDMSDASLAALGASVALAVLPHFVITHSASQNWLPFPAHPRMWVSLRCLAAF